MRERSRALWTRLGQLDPRYLVSSLITLVLVLGEARYGILGGYDRLAVALGVCVATELALSRWVRARFANTQSAYITGINLAFMITDPNTTVSTVRGRIIVTAAVAVAEASIRLAGDFHVAALNALYPAPPSLALAIVGPCANLIVLVRTPQSH